MVQGAMMPPMDPVKLLTDLIRIPSQNGINKEAGIGDYLQAAASRLGFGIRMKEYAPGRPNVLCEFSFGTETPRVLFNTHMDTKPAFQTELYNNAWKTDPFSPAEKDGKIFGVGACDTKGSIAALLSAVDIFLRTPGKKKGTLVIHFVCDEETTSEYGTLALCRAGEVHADFAVVLEPTTNRVSHAQLGNLFFCTEFHGVGGHTGIPEGKTNCFRLALAFIQQVDRWCKSKMAGSQVNGQPFMNLERFDGGCPGGTIPDYCKLFWTIRVLPGEKMEDYLRAIDKISKEFALKLPGGCRCITRPDGSGGTDSCSCRHLYIDRLIRLTGERPMVFPGAADAGFIWNNAGVPCCVFGPGDLGQAHAPNEFIKISELMGARDILCRFLDEVFLTEKRVAPAPHSRSG
jgi:acetylornithine deacetylase/succinyl-diaminopimelate desuccinylase-like protein